MFSIYRAGFFCELSYLSICHSYLCVFAVARLGIVLERILALSLQHWLSRKQQYNFVLSKNSLQSIHEKISKLIVLLGRTIV